MVHKDEIAFTAHTGPVEPVSTRPEGNNTDAVKFNDPRLRGCMMICETEEILGGVRDVRRETSVALSASGRQVLYVPKDMQNASDRSKSRLCVRNVTQAK